MPKENAKSNVVIKLKRFSTQAYKNEQRKRVIEAHSAFNKIKNQIRKLAKIEHSKTLNKIYTEIDIVSDNLIESFDIGKILKENMGKFSEIEEKATNQTPTLTAAEPTYTVVVRHASNQPILSSA